MEMLKTNLQIFWIFFRLGCTSFGGPIAHISFFHREFVTQRKWLEDSAFTDLVALCQFLPGPASSQLGMAIGAIRGGVFGSIFAFLGFTVPSACVMTLFGLGLFQFKDFISVGVLHGLALAATSVVLQALWQMGTKLCPDRSRVLLMLTSAILSSIVIGIQGQLLAILLGAVTGLLFFRESKSLPHISQIFPISKWTGLFLFSVFFLLLIGLPILNHSYLSDSLNLFDRFFRIGSLVFGGGHVVLSLLEEEIVSKGIISSENFVVGYGLVQAIPGPLFTISAFIGAMSGHGSGGYTASLVSLVAIFLPGFLLILGILPYWEQIRNYKLMSSVMVGVNASVVGLLLAVFYTPVFTSSVLTSRDFYFVSLSFVVMQFWHVPSWAIVISLSLFGYIIY